MWHEHPVQAMRACAQAHTMTEAAHQILVSTTGQGALLATVRARTTEPPCTPGKQGCWINAAPMRRTSPSNNHTGTPTEATETWPHVVRQGRAPLTVPRSSERGTSQRPGAPSLTRSVAKSMFSTFSVSGDTSAPSSGCAERCCTSAPARPPPAEGAGQLSGMGWHCNATSLWTDNRQYLDLYLIQGLLS